MRSKGISVSRILVAAFFLVAVILPLCTMLAQITKTDLIAQLSSSGVKTAISNTLLTSLTATLISLVIAFLLALCITRSNMPFKGIITMLILVPMMIPSISHGMGLVILFGANGVITNLLHLNSSIYGFWGIVWGSVLYSFPVAFLMFQDILKYEDASPYEAASVLGIPKFRQMTAITLPYLSKPLISVIFATFTLVATDYGVALMVGGNITTLSMLMYKEVVGLLDFSKGSVIGLLLLLPAVTAFLIDLFSKEKGNTAFVTKPFTPQRSPLRDAVCTSYSVLVSLAVVVIVGSFAMIGFAADYPSDISFSFKHILRAFNLGSGKYLLNSLIISLCVSVVGSAVAFITAYLTARTKSKLSSLLHLLSITSLAIPGLVLGLSYILVFKASFLYGTIALLILVNIVHFISSPYLMMYNTLGKLNADLEDVGCTLGIKRINIIFSVILPQSKYTLLEMVSYFFVNSMMTISAVSFLATTANKPISLMITQFEAQLMLECSAIVSLIILLVNIVVKASIYFAKKKGSTDELAYKKSV